MGLEMGETKCGLNEDPDPGLCVSSGRSGRLAPGPGDLSLESRSSWNPS